MRCSSLAEDPEIQTRGNAIGFRVRADPGLARELDRGETDGVFIIASRPGIVQADGPDSRYRHNLKTHAATFSREAGKITPAGTAWVDAYTLRVGS